MQGEKNCRGFRWEADDIGTRSEWAKCTASPGLFHLSGAFGMKTSAAVATASEGFMPWKTCSAQGVWFFQPPSV